MRCRQMFRVPFVTGSQESFVPGQLAVNSAREENSVGLVIGTSWCA